MVFFLAATLVVSVWVLSAAAFPSQGSVVWSAPAPPAVVAECYPLSIQFTSPIAPRNISFFYYVGSQSYAGQTIVPITTWPQSQWVDATTVFTAFSPSVPVAAGTMMALRVMAYDDSPSYLHQIVIQPNTDTSCITSAYQRGTADYNRYPRQPATTTVSPTTLAPPAGTPTHSSTVTPDPKPPGSTENTSPTIAPASPSSAEKATAGSASSSRSASALISPTTLAANSYPIVSSSSSSNSTFSSSPDTLPLPSGPSSVSTLDSASKSKHPSTGLIVGALLGAVLSLVLATACILFFVRRRNQRLRRMERERATTAYDVAPPPIQEVDAGRVMFGAAQERLPPQYEAITGHGGPRTSSEAEFRSPSGNGKGGRTFTVR